MLNFVTFFIYFLIFTTIFMNNKDYQSLVGTF